MFAQACMQYIHNLFCPLPRRMSMSCFHGGMDDSGSRWMTGLRRTREDRAVHRGWV